MKFIKDGFKGVVNGEVYPREFAKGEECPEELEQAAEALGYIRATKKSQAVLDEVATHAVEGVKEE